MGIPKASLIWCVIRGHAGYRIAGGATETFLTRVAALDLPASVSESLVPVRSVMQLLDKELVTIVFKMFPMRIRIDEASTSFVTNRLALGSATGGMLALVRKLRLLFWTALGLAFIVLRTRKQSARDCAAIA